MWRMFFSSSVVSPSFLQSEISEECHLILKTIYSPQFHLLTGFGNDGHGQNVTKAASKLVALLERSN